MAKKRTGLQGSISAIFSGVPVPKKGQPGSEPAAPGGKPDASAGLKPLAPQPRVPAPPSPVPAVTRPPVQPIPEIPPARVPPMVVAERKISQVPSKIPARKKVRAPGAGASVSPVRQKVSVALVLILAVLLFVVLAKPFDSGRPGPAAPGSTGPAVASVLPKANVKIDWPVPDVYPADLRDPMIAGSQGEVQVQAPGRLVVTAITYSEDRKIANVGTQMLSEGDTVPGTTIKVKTIELNRVEFEDETGKTWWQEVQATKN